MLNCDGRKFIFCCDAPLTLLHLFIFNKIPSWHTRAQDLLFPVTANQLKIESHRVKSHAPFQETRLESAGGKMKYKSSNAVLILNERSKPMNS